MAGTAPTAFSTTQAAPAQGPAPAAPPGGSGAAPAAPPVPIDVAFVANTNTPYRTHLHRRVAREMPELRLWSLFTHEVGTSPWLDQPPPEIRPVQFGPGEDALKQDQPSRAVHEWRKGGRIIQWLKEHQVRAVVVLGYNDAGRLRIVRWCEKAGVPCLMWADSNIHGDLARGAKWLFKRLVLPHVLAKCCALLPCGRLGREYFRKYGVDPSRTFFFPVEPDYDLILNLPAERIEQARTRFGLKPGRRRIVFSGRLVHDKRVDLAIDAFAAIADKRPEWDLVIVGDGPLRAKLEARVPASLGGRVIWTGFLADSADVGAIYRLSDVLILPSEYEPWALVINEAAAADLAIVSSSVVGAANELVREGVNGAFFPPGDLPAATAALASVTDPQQIERLRAGSRQVLEEWRTAGDPIKGLRAALRHCGVL